MVTFRRLHKNGGLNMSIAEKVKDKIRGWLEITPAQRTIYSLEETFNFETNAIKNRIWMRGDSEELESFYKQLTRDNSYFWAAAPRIKIRKIHSGLPSLMVQTLTDIVIRDFNGIKVEKAEALWKEIEADNKLTEILRKAIKEALFIGDGAFKISFNSAISEYPIIEFVPGDKVDIIYRNGRFFECVFKTEYKHNQKRYMLYEHYGFGYIKNVLTEWGKDEPLPLNALPYTEMLSDFGFNGYSETDSGVTYGKFCMATPFKIKDSTKWDYRGESIFDKKTSSFDAFDEVISQWSDAVRASRPKQYIPDKMIPRDPQTGEMLNFNQYDDRFLTIEGAFKENTQDKIEVTQPTIPSENYLQSYISFLDICLQGVISPSTLGIDTKKMDNAEAQREKEKTTLYTRNIIIEAVQNTLPLLINNVLKANDEYHTQKSGDDVEVTVEFGEYASPSFEATVETVSKARAGSAVMSIEAAVDELYGDTKEDKWKQEEITRLKEELGFVEKEEPTINEFDDLEGIAPTEDDYVQGEDE